MTKFTAYIILLLCNFHPKWISASMKSDQYTNILSVYSKFRYISIWTHFAGFQPCRSLQYSIPQKQFCHLVDYLPADNAEINIRLSLSMDIQSRFIADFKNITNIMDTPANAVQGFVINTRCSNINSIFEQVI